MSSISCIPEPRPHDAARVTFLFFRGTGNATNRRLAVRHALQDIGAPVELVNQNGDDVTGDQHPHQRLEGSGMQLPGRLSAEVISGNTGQGQDEEQGIKVKCATFAAI